MTPHNEIWKPVAGYEGQYQISNHGRVKSLARRCNCSHAGTHFTILRRERIMRTTPQGRGYLRVALRHDRTFLVHRLVAEAFLPNPLQLPDVNHLDGCKANNHVSNLEWTTPADNRRHAMDNGFYAKGEQQWQAKLTPAKVRRIRADHAAGESQASIAARYGLHRSSVRPIIARETWKHVV